MFEKIITKSTATETRESRFKKLDDFAEGRGDYISALFASAKGFNVKEREEAALMYGVGRQ